MCHKDSDQTILDLKNVSVFRGVNQVFDHLSLQLYKNENTAILGPNGSGKTTLLKLITRELMPVVRPDSHCLLFGQSRMTLWDLRKRIGLVSQDFQNDYRSLATGEEVVLSAFFGAVGIHGHHEVTAAMRKQTHSILSQLGIQELANRAYLQMSTGQQRRLLLARALIHKPEVLIFDEPTSSLDLRASLQLIRDMRDLTQQGTTLILVTHHINEVIPEITRTVFLQNGKIIADEDKQVLLNDRSISDLYGVNVKLQQENGYYQAYPT